MDALRIAIIAPQIPFARGGAELHVDLTAEALKEAGHEVDVLTAPYFWHDRASVLDQLLAWRLFDLEGPIEDEEGGSIDLVIATKFPSYLIRHPRKIAWVFHQQREVYDLHGTEFGPFSMAEQDSGLRKAVQQIDRIALGETRQIFTNSKNVARRLDDYCGIPAQALYAPPKLASRIHPGPFGDHLFVVARLDPIKRIDLTLRALAKTRSDIGIRIAGTGSEAERLKKLAGELDLADRVEFLGFVSDEQVVEELATCKGVVITPRDEDYGFTTLEAFLAGKPVVTTEDAGGILEFTEHGVTGLVSEPEPEAIAANMDVLHDKPALAEELGERGRDSILEVANWDYVVEQLLATVPDRGSSG